MDRFTLEKGRWYAAEIISEFFGNHVRSYTPIRVHDVQPQGGRCYALDFYHANYPQGVQSKRYTLQTVERNRFFILARSTHHEPTRWLLIYDINASWLRKHFGIEIDDDRNVADWLSRNV
ncbi:MAG: hypothetical protein ACLFSG_03800 [Halothiobacillaceae bacterium]